MRVVGIGLSSVILFLFSLTLPAFCSGADSVQRITPLELSRMLDRGDNVLILDVRGGISRKKPPALIKGAVRMPLAKLYRGEGLPMDLEKKIVTYCT